MQVCRINYHGWKTYIFWAVSFFITSVSLRWIHECLHGIFAELTGGSAGNVYIMDWVLLYPIFAIDVSGGNPFWVIEGTLIATWLLALIIVLFTSYPFLSRVMNVCDAVNVSGWLFGVRLGAIFEMFGQAIYAMPNFVIFFGDLYHIGGDGYYMALLFESIGYPVEYQYIVAITMLLGAFFTLVWSLKCDPMFCGYCSYSIG